MREYGGGLLKTRVHTFRVDFTLENKIQELAKLHNTSSSKVIRYCIQKVIQQEVPAIEKKPVGRPRVKEKPPSVKYIKTQKQLDELNLQFAEYRKKQQLAVGLKFLELHEQGKLGIYAKELEKVLFDL